MAIQLNCKHRKYSETLEDMVNQVVVPPTGVQRLWIWIWQKFNYLISIVTNRECDSEIRRHTRKVKDAFQKLIKVLRDQKICLETTKKLLNCCVISNIPHGSECWAMSSLIKKRLEAIETTNKQ